MKPRIRTIATILIAMPSLAEARVIDNYSFLFADQVVPVATPAPNNDNAVTASPNQITYPNFFPATNFNSLTPADTGFFVQNSGGTTEYLFTETVKNNSGVAWSGFQLQIGSGAGANFLPGGGFVIPEILFPDFDAPTRDPSPASSVFSTLAATLVQLSWSGGTVPAGGSATFSFSIDTPDDILPQNGHTSFTIRQFPTAVPEPSALVLLGCGVLSAIRFRASVKYTLQKPGFIA